MSRPSPMPLTPAAVLRALQRHWRKSAGVLAVVGAATVAALIFWPRSYQSEAKLFVKLGRPVLTVDPTVDTQQAVSVQESRETEVNSIVEVLESRALAEQVVAQISPAVILGKQPFVAKNAAPPTTGPSPMLTSAAPQSAEFEKAVKVVKSELKTFTPRKTTIVSISYQAESPALAQAVVSTYLENYLHEHARVNRTVGSYEFFVKQAAASHAKLKTVSDAFRDAKNEVGLASVDGRRGSLQGQITSVEEQMVIAETDLATAHGAIAALEEAIATLPQRRLSAETSGFPNPAADQMRHQLYVRQIRLEELLSKYTEEHPEVIALREEVANANSILDKQPVARVQRTEGANPAREKLEQDLLSERAKAGSLEARSEELHAQYALLLTELRALNHHEVRLAEMEREVHMAENVYRDYAEKLERARMDNAIDSQHISNVNILQPASYVARPVSPKRTVVAAMGLMFGLTSALGVALLCEYLNPSMSSIEDLQTQLSVPVFLSIPRTAPGSTLLN